MSERLALFPGSFDPITLGHVDILMRSCDLFDRVLVLIADGGKAGFLSVERRAKLWRDTIDAHPDLRACEVDTFSGLLVDEFKRRHACAVVRGVRSAMDYEHEWGLHMVNRTLMPGFVTVWLPARDDLAALSSSLVRDVARHGGPLDGLVPRVVAVALSSEPLD
jgi:pantetheine-phosphate adenylyltransferase